MWSRNWTCCAYLQGALVREGFAEDRRMKPPCMRPKETKGSRSPRNPDEKFPNNTNRPCQEIHQQIIPKDPPEFPQDAPQEITK